MLLPSTILRCSVPVSDAFEFRRRGSREFWLVLPGARFIPR